MPRKTAINLTPTRVERHRHSGGGPKQQFLWDAQVPGLGVEAVAGGRKTWVFRYRLADKAKRISFAPFGAMRLDEARKVAGRFRGCVDGGIDPAVERRHKREAVSVRELHDSYVDSSLFKSKSKDFQANFRSTMKKYVLPVIGDTMARGVRREDVKVLLHPTIEAGKYAMSQATLTHLKILFMWGMEQPVPLLDSLPTEGVRIPRKPGAAQSKPWLDTADKLRVAWYFDGPVQARALIRWALLTGCRRDEVRLTERGWIVEDIWRVPATKNERDLVLPVTDAMQAVIDEMKSTFPHSPVLFPATTDQRKPMPRGTLDYIVRTGTSGEWSMHVLRHTVESWLQELEVMEEHRNLILNHWSGRMTERYGHSLQLERKRKTLDLWHIKLMELVNDS